MSCSNKRDWITLGSGSLALGVQIIAASDAFAHGGPHGDEAQPITTPSSDQHQPQTSETTTRELSDEPYTDETVMPSSGVMKTMDEVPVTQASPTKSTSEASISGGFSFGVGESLLGLLIVGPVLLISLKNRYQS